MLTKEQIKDYHRDGYVVVRGFLSVAEIERLYSVAVGDEAM